MAGPNPLDMHVGKRLRFGRTMQGLSQESVGEAIGVTFQQIQKYERGVNCIRSSKLYALAKLLKVPVAFFFEDFEDEEGYSIPGAADSGGMDDAEMEVMSNRENMELMKAFNKISDPKVRTRVLDLIRAMGNKDIMF